MDDDSAFVVEVSLNNLAGNLTRKFKRLFSEFGAALWLTQTVPHEGVDQNGSPIVETSPFRTLRRGVYYTEENPRLYLEPEEIMSIRQVKAGRGQRYLGSLLRENQPAAA